MKFETSKNFDKLVLKINDQAVKLRLNKIMKKVAACKRLEEISNLTPIVGRPGYFRIKFGDYRLGISLENDTVWFLYFGKRDESTYKKFP